MKIFAFIRYFLLQVFHLLAGHLHGTIHLFLRFVSFKSECFDLMLGEFNLLVALLQAHHHLILMSLKLSALKFKCLIMAILELAQFFFILLSLSFGGLRDAVALLLMSLLQLLLISMELVTEMHKLVFVLLTGLSDALSTLLLFILELFISLLLLGIHAFLRLFRQLELLRLELFAQV